MVVLICRQWTDGRGPRHGHGPRPTPGGQEFFFDGNSVSQEQFTVVAGDVANRAPSLFVSLLYSS